MNENIQLAFEIFGIGWGGIFVVMALLFITIKLLMKIFPAKK